MTYYLKPTGDQQQRAYIDYLVKRLTDWRKAGQSFGQKFSGTASVVVTIRILQSQLKCSLYAPEKFEEVCAFIKTKIEATILGKRNKAKGVRCYHSFTEHGIKKTNLQTKSKDLPLIPGSAGVSPASPANIQHPTSNIQHPIEDAPRISLFLESSGPEQPDTHQPGRTETPGRETPARTFSKRQLTVARERLQALRSAWNNWTEFPQATQGEIAGFIGLTDSKFSALLKLAGAATRGTGRLHARARCHRLLFGANGESEGTALTRLAPPECKKDDVGFLPSETELAVVRGIYTKLDESTPHGRGRGSSIVVAYRLAAKSDDPQIASRLSETFRDTVLQRTTKSVPPSWARLMQLPVGVLRAVRDSRSITAHSISTPRSRTYVDANGAQLPLRPGTIFEADDGTLNFYASIPWPFGGDKCSEKYGVKLGRWQLLAVADVASEQCISADIVCRSLGQYRGEDSAALLGRTMLEVCEPELWRLERGSWESKMVRDALALCRVPVTNAWHSKQKNVIERFFDRLWTPASLIRGHVGRDRDADKFKQVYDIVLACQDGRRDPNDFFLTLSQAAPEIYQAINFVNTEPIKSGRGWGTWIPQERWQTFMSANERPKLDAQFKTFFAREQREWTVRNCCLGGSVNGPLIKFPTYFQCAELWEFEGCRVICYFDPYAETVTGTLVLSEAWRTYKPGHVIARDVPALELPPQAILADEWENAGSTRSLAIRKQLAKAVRTEMWNWRGEHRTEVRSGDSLAVRVQRGRNDAAESRNPPSNIQHPQPIEFARTRDSVAALFGG